MDLSHMHVHSGQCYRGQDNVWHPFSHFPGEFGLISLTHFILHLRAPAITTPGPLPAALQHLHVSKHTN